ncbi:MAG TPA: PEP-CTERM sorting domain-containing protein [Paludibaculum sp.]
MRIGLWLAVLSSIGATQLSALPVTFTGTAGNRSAIAIFEMQGANLVITLTNRATVDQNAPTDILTAFLFTLDGSPALTRVSALWPAGSDVVCGAGTATCGKPLDNVVGGEWAYKSGLNVTTGGFTSNYGISSTGVGLFGPGDRFPGPNLQGPDDPGGLQFGIVSKAWLPAGDNGGLSGSGFIRDSVIFTLSGLGSNSDLAKLVSNVAFQYGTDLTEPRIPGTPGRTIENVVPEPGTYALMGAGLMGLYFLKRRSV